MWDVDGRKVLDFAPATGPNIRQHGEQEYVDAAHDQLERIFSVAAGMLPTLLEMETAATIFAHVPFAEDGRFVTTGSESVQMVIRLARASTQRPYSVRFDGQYHVWIETVLGMGGNSDAGVAPHAAGDSTDPMHAEGRSQYAFADSFKAPRNDAGALGRVLAQRGHEAALFLMDAVMTNGGRCLPRPAFLGRVPARCARHDVMLCIDEGVTGFGMRLCGAQRRYHVTPGLHDVRRRAGGPHCAGGHRRTSRRARAPAREPGGQRGYLSTLRRSASRRPGNDTDVGAG